MSGLSFNISWQNKLQYNITICCMAKDDQVSTAIKCDDDMHSGEITILSFIASNESGLATLISSSYLIVMISPRRMMIILICLASPCRVQWLTNATCYSWWWPGWLVDSRHGDLKNLWIMRLFAGIISFETHIVVA